jgi:hypothetical protein
MAFEAEIEGVREALGAWLYAQLSQEFPTVEVLSEWPDGQVLPELAVVVLATGEADVEPHNPRVVSTAPGVNASGVVTYAYAYAEQIQLELDCWANNKPRRDALARAVRDALNQPPQASLSSGGAAWPTLSRRSYLSLQVPALYGSIFTYRFTSVPTIDEASGKAEKNEWRSHFRGTADGALWEQDTMALIQRVHLTGTAGGQALAVARPASETQLIVTPRVLALHVGGGSSPLQAIAVSDDGTTLDVTQLATWSTSSPSVATVASGIVAPVGAGTASITASFGGRSASSVVSVS